MPLAEPEPCPSTVVVKRFLMYPSSSQLAILHQLRWTFFPEGIFSQVPAAEWLRLLRLTDPLIQYTKARQREMYQVGEGRQLLLLLVGHYLDIH
jgi:hypothetical protein